LAKCLPFLWRIDPIEPDFVLAPIGIQHGNRIAVGNGHNSATYRLSERRKRQKE
jgi:hypothetical protein